MLTALVLGGAECVRTDAERALAMFAPDAVFAVNNIGIVWPGRLDYWVTLHPGPVEDDWVGIEAAMRRRLAAGLNRPQTWGHKAAKGIDRHTPDWAGSSGLLAVKVARLEGFDRIVLAGVPMDNRRHYYGDKPWSHNTIFRRAWERRRLEIAPFVRSMSGLTKEMFGEPTPEWFGSTSPAGDAGISTRS